MSKRELTPHEIKMRGLEAVARELGPYGFVRFLEQYEMGSGDYTADRDAVIGDPDVDEIVREIETMRGEAESESTPQKKRRHAG